VDLTIETEKDLSVDTAHRVTVEVETAIQALLPNCSVMVHVDPGTENSAVCPEQSDEAALPTI
jgi:divalent metal cation (Fe/Co/Zn/Cd) transporter